MFANVESKIIDFTSNKELINHQRNFKGFPRFVQKCC